MAVHIRECNLCGSDRLDPLAIRSDNIPVLRCAACGHAMVAEYPEDLSIFYENSYYFGPEDSGVGYSDYQYMAEHGVSWAAGLVRLLEPQGDVLDIGCADGHLLSCLRKTHHGFGIEVNPRMAGLCRDKGFSIIGDDLLDPRIPERYRGAFDVVTAIAVFEHIPDFQASVRTALDLMKPEGVLLFEVPLISESHPSEIWYRSSLEHIHYPSEQSLKRLFSSLSLDLVGGECVIQDYGSTYIGMVRKDPGRSHSDRLLYERVVQGPIWDLQTKLERQCRCWIELVHAAHSDPELVELLPELDPGDLTPYLWRRISQLWMNDGNRLSYQKKEVERISLALANELSLASESRQELGKLATALESETQQRGSLETALEAERTLAATLQGEIDRQNRLLVELDRNLEPLKQQLTLAQEENCGLKTALDGQKSHALHLESSLETEKSNGVRLQRELQQHEDQIGRLMMDTEQLRGEIMDRNRRIDDLRNSWSWRITGPLRRMVSLLRMKH